MWDQSKVQNRVKQVHCRAHVGRVFKIRELLFYNTANDLINFEFTNDSECANDPSLIEGASSCSPQVLPYCKAFLQSSSGYLQDAELHLPA